MKNTVYRLGMGAAVWAACMASALALGVSDYCSGPVRIALFEFGALYRSASNDGIDAGLIDVLEKRTGCTFERVVLPRARIWKELEAGTLDMATAAVPSPERKAYLHFSPYMRARNIVLVRKAAVLAKLTAPSFESSALRMGVVRGFRHEAFYDSLVMRMRASGRVTEAKDVAELLRMLDRKLVDVVLSQPVVYSQYLSPEALAQTYAIHDWAPAEEFSVGSLVFSRKSFTGEHAKHWDALVVSLLRDGTMFKLARTYLTAAQSQDLVYTGQRLLD